MRISASLAWSDWTSKASQPNMRSTARYANRSVTGTDSARARGARAARQLTQSSQETQASGYDRILGTHSLAIAATALLPLSHALTGGLRPYAPAGWLAAILGFSALLALVALSVPTRRALRTRPVEAIG